MWLHSRVRMNVPVKHNKKKFVPQNHLFSFSATRGDLAKAAQNRDIHDIHWFFHLQNNKQKHKIIQWPQFSSSQLSTFSWKERCKGMVGDHRGFAVPCLSPPRKMAWKRKHIFPKSFIFGIYEWCIYIYTVYIIYIDHSYTSRHSGSIFGMNSILSRK